MQVLGKPLPIYYHLVSLGVNQQRSAQKSIKYRTIGLECYLFIARLRADLCRMMKHI